MLFKVVIVGVLYNFISLSKSMIYQEMKEPDPNYRRQFFLEEYVSINREEHCLFL